MTNAKLKAYVDRVKALIEQQKTIGADITQVCKDAKEADDLEPTMIRFAARELLIDSAKRNERDDKRHRYLHAVGLAVDMVSNGDVSLREAAKAFGVSKSSVHRALAVPEVSHDPETGEVTGPQPKPANVIAASAWHEVTTSRAAFEAAREAEKAAERERRRAEREARDRRNVEIDNDPLTLPAHLVRSRVSA